MSKIAAVDACFGENVFVFLSDLSSFLPSFLSSFALAWVCVGRLIDVDAFREELMLISPQDA